MLFVFFVLLYFILFHFGNFFLLFHVEKIPFLECKPYVDAGIDTLMSIYDGLGPSISFRNMEKARPLREEMDGKVINLPPESALLL